MKAYEVIYTNGDRNMRPSSKTTYAWVKSVKPGKSKENARDPFILRLGKTKPSQIGYDIEEIDQETQQSVINLRYANFCNERLKAIYEEEVKEVGEIETRLVSLSKEPERKPQKRETRLATNVNTCLVKNLNRVLFTTTQDITQKSHQLDQLQKNPKLLENEQLMVLAKELQNEIDLLIKVRQLHQLAMAEDRKVREQEVSNKIIEKQQEAIEIEKKLDLIEDEIVKSEKIGAISNNKVKDLQNQIKSRQKKLNKLRASIDLVEKESESLQKECDKLEGIDQNQPNQLLETETFFLYMKIYTEEHKLGLSLIRSFFEEVTKVKTQASFDELVTDYWGIVKKDSTTELLFKLHEEFSRKSGQSQLFPQYKGWSKALSSPTETQPQPPITADTQLIEWLQVHIASYHPISLMQIVNQHNSKRAFTDLFRLDDPFRSENKQNQPIVSESQVQPKESNTEDNQEPAKEQENNEECRKSPEEVQKKEEEFSEDFEKDCQDS